MDQDKRQHNFHKMTGIHSSSEIAKEDLQTDKKLVLKSTNKYPGTYGKNFNPRFSWLADSKLLHST